MKDPRTRAFIECAMRETGMDLNQLALAIGYKSLPRVYKGEIPLPAHRKTHIGLLARIADPADNGVEIGTPLLLTLLGLPEGSPRLAITQAYMAWEAAQDREKAKHLNALAGTLFEAALSAARQANALEGGAE